MKHEIIETNGTNMVQADLNEIKFFVRRSRSPGAYARLKESIGELGLRQPIHVRDISSWPRSERRRPDGAFERLRNREAFYERRGGTHLSQCERAGNCCRSLKGGALWRRPN